MWSLRQIRIKHYGQVETRIPLVENAKLGNGKLSSGSECRCPVLKDTVCGIFETNDTISKDGEPVWLVTTTNNSSGVRDRVFFEGVTLHSNR